jgi:hypothetical protein
MKMPESHPFRGPERFEDPQYEGLVYNNQFYGDWRKFWGYEEIVYKNIIIYYLEYCGYRF